MGKFYGACGVEGCEECLPRFDEDNNVIEESGVRAGEGEDSGRRCDRCDLRVPWAPYCTNCGREF